MKTIIFLMIYLINCSTIAQKWTTEQINKANTAENIEYLTQSEKDAIMYINLARLYPRDFVKYELENYFGPESYPNYYSGSEYRESLIKSLMTMRPVPALKFDQDLYESAKCFAIESGGLGLVSHKRVNCEMKYRAECCSYGLESGKEFIIDLLVDKNVESLGHRKICLDGDLSRVGIGVSTHKKFKFCAVANFK